MRAKPNDGTPTPPMPPSGFTIIPLRITIDCALGLPDALAAQPGYAQQWVADHLSFAATLARTIENVSIDERPGGIVRKA